jgi:site-specific DNA-methyltransferase (cytosine-N4-specific)
LNWIDLDDIGPRALIDQLIATAYATDRASLGGNRTRGTDYHCSPVLERSPALAAYVTAIRTAPRDRTARVVAFAADLERSVATMMGALKVNGYAVVTIGNRRVADRPVPLDAIVCDLVSAHKASFVGAVRRTIHRKKMARKNAITDTMSDETTLIFRRADTGLPHG